MQDQARGQSLHTCRIVFDKGCGKQKDSMKWPEKFGLNMPGQFRRGDRRESIFFDNKDREMFLATLAEMCERTGAVVYSYILMNNHYHLLLESNFAE